MLCTDDKKAAKQHALWAWAAEHAPLRQLRVDVIAAGAGGPARVRAAMRTAMSRLQQRRPQLEVLCESVNPLVAGIAQDFRRAV